jgi:multiple sugar transport system substrate-binding protein
MVEFWADLGKISDNPEGSSVVGQWGVAPLPKGPGPAGKTAAPLNAGWSLGVSALSSRRELALEFLKFTLRPDIGLRISTITGGLDPCRWSIYDLPTYRSSVTEGLAEAAGTAVKSAAVPWPTNAQWLALQGCLHQNLYQALTGKKPAQDALDDTQAAWCNIL